MKKTVKIIMISVICIIMCVLLTGCGNNTKNETETIIANEKDDKYYLDERIELKEPRVNWWKVSEFGRGINTLIIEVENENNVDIDFEMNVTHYLNKQEVGISENLYYNCLKAHEKGIIYFNWQIPVTDDIKVEYTELEKSYYKPVDFEVVKNGKVDDGSIYVELDIKEDYSNGKITVVTYNFNEVVFVNYYDFYKGQEAKENIETLWPFDRYEVYYNIYK